MSCALGNELQRIDWSERSSSTLTSAVDDYVPLQSLSLPLIDYERVFDSFQIGKNLDLTLPFISDFLENESSNTVPASPGHSHFGPEPYSDIPPSMPKSELARYTFGYDDASADIITAIPACVPNSDKSAWIGDNEERKPIEGRVSVMIDQGHDSWDSLTERSDETLFVPEELQKYMALLRNNYEDRPPTGRLSYQRWFYADLPTKIKRSFLDPEELLVAEQEMASKIWYLTNAP